MDNTDDLYYLNLSRESNLGLPEAELSAKEIEKKINNISEKQRKPFEMYNTGYKYEEIANKLNISIGTVKSRIFFTRKKLMAELKEY